MQALPAQARRELRRLGRGDLVVGIPSFNNAATVGHVVRTAAEGVVRHFPGVAAVVVNADGGSADGTREVVSSTPVPDPVRVVCTVYEGIPGKGSAVRAILEAVQTLQARCCVLLDADVRSVQPWWVHRLAGPVLSGQADYVAPVYVRHKNDGTITNHLAYPMTRALYGVRIRQPIGGDFGLSGPLAARLLAKPVWESDVARFGVDIWMTTTAVCEGFRAVQAHLGAKVHDPRDPAGALGPMFQQVVGTLFSLLAVYPARWRQVQGSRPVPEVGLPVDAQPEPVSISISALVERFREGWRAHGSLWAQVVSGDVREQLQRAAELGPAGILEERWWARAVYDFAVAFHRDDLDPDAVVSALVPVYFGRVASFAKETSDADWMEAERVVERQAGVFEQEKPRLMTAWDRL
ncbi:MAG: glycosyl transferase family 2 [candidate division GAL15 bacterium]